MFYLRLGMLMMIILLFVFIKFFSLAFNVLRVGRICRFFFISDGRIR